MTLLRIQKYIPAAPEYILKCKENITLSKPVLFRSGQCLFYLAYKSLTEVTYIVDWQFSHSLEFTAKGCLWIFRPRLERYCFIKKQFCRFMAVFVLSA